MSQKQANSQPCTQMLSTLSCSVSVVAAGQSPMDRLCCGPGSTMDAWLCLCCAQQSHPRAELAFPLFLCMSLFLVPGSSGTCCECPAPTQAVPLLSWLPGLAQTGRESETESSVVCTSVLSFTTSDFSIPFIQYFVWRYSEITPGLQHPFSRRGDDYQKNTHTRSVSQGNVAFPDWNPGPSEIRGRYPIVAAEIKCHLISSRDMSVVQAYQGCCFSEGSLGAAMAACACCLLVPQLGMRGRGRL